MSTELWEQLVKLVEVLIIPFSVWLVKTLAAIQKETTELKTVLIGVDGKNGIRSRVIRIERKLENLPVKEMEEDV